MCIRIRCAQPRAFSRGLNAPQSHTVIVEKTSRWASRPHFHVGAHFNKQIESLLIINTHSDAREQSTDINKGECWFHNVQKLLDEELIEPQWGLFSPHSTSPLQGLGEFTFHIILRPLLHSLHKETAMLFTCHALPPHPIVLQVFHLFNPQHSFSAVHSPRFSISIFFF